MKILLQHKIFIGYFLLMAIIGSMVAIVLHERNRVQKIENESIAIFHPHDKFMTVSSLCSFNHFLFGCGWFPNANIV